MKRKSFLISLLIPLALCACAETGTSSEPVATSAPDSVVSSVQDSSSQEESSAAESSNEDSSQTDHDSGELSESEYYELSGLHEEYETVDDFLNSGFIEKYYDGYKVWHDHEGINYIPTIDDEVTQRGVTARFGHYAIHYTYKGKPMDAYVDMLSGRFASAEDIYNKLYKRYARDKSVLKHLSYDKDKDIVINDEKGDVIIGYVCTINNIGLKVEISTYDEKCTIDDIIEFSQHIKFE